MNVLNNYEAGESQFLVEVSLEGMGTVNLKLFGMMTPEEALDGVIEIMASNSLVGVASPSGAPCAIRTSAVNFVAIVPRPETEGQPDVNP